jgi:hypothetical protein
MFPRMEVLAPNLGNMISVNVSTHKNEHQQSVNRVLTGHQQMWVKHLYESVGCVAAFVKAYTSVWLVEWNIRRYSCQRRSQYFRSVYWEDYCLRPKARG